ncbi:MAG: chloride channel protein [Planctomycetes bacterium]|nr:chloride channel protein [Planctomycetota bacterium]
MNEASSIFKRAMAGFRKPAARWMRLFAIGIIVGVIGGLSAAALHQLLEIGTEHVVGHFAKNLTGLDNFRFEWALLLLPTIGGLASGLITWRFVPTAREHGTNAVARSFHHRMGELPLKGPLVRAAAVVGVISCGGCCGPEGPIAGLGAAIGSSVGKFFKVSARERRIMLLAGCAAGIGAIFQCPLGGALFATSIIYSEEEFESGAMVPSFVASVIAYTTFKTVLGGLGSGGFLLSTNLAGGLTFSHPMELIPYAVLGPLCGIVAAFLGMMFINVEERLVPRLPIPGWLIPGIGGLATGALACMLPQVMDYRYEFIQNSMTGFKHHEGILNSGSWNLVYLFGAVALAKCVANVCTVGSGGAGGNFGPCVFIGGAVGAFLGALIEALYPGQIPENLRQSLIPVGIGGVVAAAMRTPVAAMVMVMEMTGSYGLIVPLMLVCMSAYVIGRKWGINTEQVPTSAQSPTHAGDAIIHLLENWHVEHIMERNWGDTVAPDATLKSMIQRVRPGTRPVFAVVSDARLVGIISLTDIRRIMEEPALADAVIASDMMTEKVSVLLADDDVYHALNEFRRGNHQVMPVVSHERILLGMLSRERIYDAIRESLAESQRLMFEEHDGLAAIQQEGQLQQLVMGVTPMKRDIIQRLLVPIDALGKSLRETDFRRRYGAQVIAIEDADGRVLCPPDLDNPLTSDQRLLAIVWNEPAMDSSPSNAGK